jgi:hypothetical protein
MLKPGLDFGLDFGLWAFNKSQIVNNKILAFKKIGKIASKYFAHP